MLDAFKQPWGMGTPCVRTYLQWRVDSRSTGHVHCSATGVVVRGLSLSRMTSFCKRFPDEANAVGGPESFGRSVIKRRVT